VTAQTIERIEPARTALLLMDYQRGIIDQLPQGEALVTKARDTIDLLRGHGATIGYVRVAFADGEAPAGTMGKRIPPERLAAFHADAPATQIHDQVAPQAGDIIVRKVRVGPFGTTDLHDQLQAKGIDTLIPAGISTSGVVLSAVRDGHDRDYRLIVLSDLSADRELDVHEFLINRVISKQADVISTADLPGLLNN
jgi:nicotinamidase-related amidase